MIDDPKALAAKAYNAAADFFDAPALSFWDRIGRRTVERLSLRPGDRVLDACCGSGASAIAAAEAVGAGGHVLGVDLAENLLRLARAKADRRGVRHAEFRCADIEAGEPGDGTYDAVVCVFGIFFLPDMPRGVRRLWRWLRQRGQLAITTWGPRMLEPGSSAFWSAVAAERPDLHRRFNPWDRIVRPEALRAMLLEAGVSASEILAESSSQALDSPADFWTIALGSGFRGTIEQLAADQRDRVRSSTLKILSERNVRCVETNAIYALARKVP
jgi:ubiquinone/menaquinone biosynthesis C-methylase UbiE